MASLKRLLLGLGPLTRITTASDAPQTLSDLPSYSQQRPCATSCFFTSNGQDLIGGAIQCCAAYTDNDCSTPVDDACYCRADLRSSAVLYLSRCVDTRCSSRAVDFSSAVAVYDGYCGAVAATATGGPPPPPPTRTAGGADVGSGSTVTIVMTQTVGSGAGMQGVSAVSLVVVVVLIMIFQSAITKSTS